jgi:hypothetical protein
MINMNTLLTAEEAKRIADNSPSLMYINNKIQEAAEKGLYKCAIQPCLPEEKVLVYKDFGYTVIQCNDYTLISW